MGIVQLIIDFLLGPIALFDVITNLGYLGRELTQTVEFIASGEIGLVLSAFFTGNLLMSKAVAGFFGTLFWLSVLASR